MRKQYRFPRYVIGMVTLIAVLVAVILAAQSTKAEAAQIIPVETIPYTPETKYFPPETMAEIRTTEEETTTAAETETETEPVRSYSDEDLEVLTRVLTGECQGESWDMQVAVGSVVLNRVADPEYPDTIKGVVFDRHNGTQYQCTRDGNYYRTPTDRNREVAQFLLENGSQLPENVIYQGQFKQGNGVCKKIGHEYFCYR